MNWNDAIAGELREVLETLQNTFDSLQIDFFVIGAVARDIWYAESGRTSRRTKDIDFAVFVGNPDEYEAIKQYLRETKGYRDIRGNSFVMLTPRGTQVDILPFGAIENDGGAQIEGQGLTNIRVDGMLEVFEAGTKAVTTPGGREFRVASLPAIVLLKLIAYDDRPEVRQKDAGDIANILESYSELQSDLIYEHHNDLFEVEEAEMGQLAFENIAAKVVGREIRKIIQYNESLLQRVQSILAGFRSQREDSTFVRAMMGETGRPASEAIGWLEKLSEGLQ
jgi:predicted nucleotidyltransferase